MIKEYFQKLRELLDEVENEEQDKMSIAAHEIARCIQNDGIVHVFGSGHSHMLAEELFYRAGGLAPISPILIEDLMLHKGAVESSNLEKKSGLAKGKLSSSKILAGDIVIVASTSGRNPVPIEVAEIARERGAYIIAITSPRYAATQASRHESGKYLFEMVDLTIDNHIEVGDTLLHHPNSASGFSSGSSIIGMTIVNAIMAETIQLMLEEGKEPPVFLSNNANDAGSHNQRLIDRYKERIPMLVTNIYK
ncbi:SIS domain-containing protein [Robertmurraya korlensis]|uniref:SIS domain-containing protein n=1 Tax=Robertmurraya korlensis TaxID=519977 RepID=UPI000825AF6B|nr:SIS domain-containing protein [Robertmurraya korlensis]